MKVSGRMGLSWEVEKNNQNAVCLSLKTNKNDEELKRKITVDEACVIESPKK